MAGLTTEPMKKMKIKFIIFKNDLAIDLPQML